LCQQPTRYRRSAPANERMKLAEEVFVTCVSCLTTHYTGGRARVHSDGPDARLHAPPPRELDLRGEGLMCYGATTIPNRVPTWLGKTLD
jgi:hypothetical protein